MTIQTEIRAEPKVKTTADVLRHAARIIEERGHAKGALEDDEGGVCALGAILVASSGSSNDWGPNGREASCALSNTVGYSIAGWNNRPERTASEVIAALRAAADAADR